MGKKKKNKSKNRPKLTGRDKALYSAAIIAPIILFAALVFLYTACKKDAVFADPGIIAYDETPWAFAAAIMFVVFFIFIISIVERRTLRGIPFFQIKAAHTMQSEKAAERARKAKFKGAVAFAVALLLAVLFTVSAFASKKALMKNGDVVYFGAMGAEKLSAKDGDVEEIVLQVEWRKSSGRGYTGRYRLEIILYTEEGSAIYLSRGSFRSNEEMFAYLDARAERVSTLGDIEDYIKEVNMNGAEAEKWRSYWE